MRRELFDIRTQLMAEDSSIEWANEFSSTTIAGLSTGDDLTPGVYEGGFKTWECAIDLAQYLVGQWETIVGPVETRGLHVIEVRDLGSFRFAKHLATQTRLLLHFQKGGCRS